jgi:excisionase family DNA binding protein
LTPEETAQQLKVEVPEILLLIEQGKLRAIRIGSNTRIPEPELEKLPVTCAAGPAPVDAPDSLALETPPENTRLVATRTGRATFRVSGSIAAGAEIWPGKMRYPIKFPKSFMDALLAHFFRGRGRSGRQFRRPSARERGRVHPAETQNEDESGRLCRGAAD